MNFLHQSRSVINIPERWIQFQPEGEVIDEERLCETPLLSMEEKVGGVEEEINKKIVELEGVSQTRKGQLGQLLIKNKRIFNERPGLITGYQHSFRVTDSTPYLQKGWPVPIKHQRAVQEEIKRMLDYGVIERANSPYVQPLVTVIKRDGSVRLCLDARKVNSITIPDYEGPPPINEILARCSNIKVMSTIDLTNSFWQVPLHEECRDHTGFLYDCLLYTSKLM